MQQLYSETHLNKSVYFSQKEINKKKENVFMHF